MKGDFSKLNNLFKAGEKHFSGVFKQQGRVQLDSDWNEKNAIIGHQQEIRTLDIIGESGAPVHDGGFQILHPGSGSGLEDDFLITTGRFYSGGLLCETTPTTKLPVKEFKEDEDDPSIFNRVIVDDLQLEGIDLVKGQWVQIVSDEKPDGIITKIENIDQETLIIELKDDVTSLKDYHHPYLKLLISYSKQPDHPNAEWSPEEGKTDLIYLDVWERHITHIEDPELREVALEGPDTETRTKIISQVKILADVGITQCGEVHDKWNDLTKTPDGRLSAKVNPGVQPDDPCHLGESGGYLGLENYLYRVEIHEGGEPNEATFTWSRNNACHIYAIEEFIDADKKIRLTQQGRDEILKIYPGDWIELSNDEIDLNTDARGTLMQVKKVEGTLLTFDSGVSAFKKGAHPKIRRWDISSSSSTGKTIIKTETKIPLEYGIEIEFTGTQFKSGDYWVFSARSLTGEIEILDRAQPYGVKHSYCRLALITKQADKSFHIQDCRKLFPPLTEIPVSKGGCCTVTVGEKEKYQDIQSAVDALNDGTGVVCIKPGTYVINEPIFIKEGKNITIKGCGGKPVIENNNEHTDEASVFQIIKSGIIKIQNLYCSSLHGNITIDVQSCTKFYLSNCIITTKESNSTAVGSLTFSGSCTIISIVDNIINGNVGIRFADKIHPVDDVRIKNNSITATSTGIFLNNPRTQFHNFIIVDNSIMGCHVAGIHIEASDSERSFDRFQRVIQRNSIAVEGSGITINARDSLILDNEIRINPVGNDESRGINVLAPDTTIQNNTIRGFTEEDGVFSNGGIYINLNKYEFSDDPINQQIVIRENKIIGGSRNGIEIFSNINGLYIQNNFIQNMGLNGIAAIDDMDNLKNLKIQGNHIENCHLSISENNFWWGYAAIVLSNIEHCQILENAIIINEYRYSSFSISGVWAGNVNDFLIDGNQIIDNRTDNIDAEKGLIHINSTDKSKIIRITNNTLITDHAPALVVHGPDHGPSGNYKATNENAIISHNHFESRFPEQYVVDINISKCIFSNNYVEGVQGGDIVYLGYGWNIIARGNIANGYIRSEFPNPPTQGVIIEDIVII